MALNKSSKFSVADGFDFIKIDENNEDSIKKYDFSESFNSESNNTYHKNENNQESENLYYRTKENPTLLGTTQGRKGKKLKRINMAFSDMNYDFIFFQARRSGLTATAFVNLIIDEYRRKHEGR